MKIDNIDVLRKSILIFDTSALIDLYYLSEDKQIQLLDEIYQSFKERLYVIGQVEYEFFKNRENVKRKKIEKYQHLSKIPENKTLDGGHLYKINEGTDQILKLVEKNLRNQLKTFLEKIRDDSSHPFLDTELGQTIEGKIDDLVHFMKGFQQEVKNEIESIELVIDTKIEKINNTDNDRIADFVNASSKGYHLTFSEKMILIDEGKKRYEHKIPPGYLDSQKEGFQKFGDFFVWKEVLFTQKITKTDVIFITNDSKQDWWSSSKNGEKSIPRYELLEEFRESSKKSLYMLKLNEFLRVFSQSIISLPDETLDEIDEITDSHYQEYPIVDSVADWIADQYESDDLVGIEFRNEEIVNQVLSIDLVAVHGSFDQRAYKLFHIKHGRFISSLKFRHKLLRFYEEKISTANYDKLVLIYICDDSYTANKLHNYVTNSKNLNELKEGRNIEAIVGFIDLKNRFCQVIDKSPNKA